MWHEGSILIPVGETKTTVCKYQVRTCEMESAYGINEGKILRLVISINENTTAEYDEGWVIEPDEKDKATLIAYSILLYNHN